jgi:hypothetical protein
MAAARKEAGIEVYTSDVAEQAKFLFVGDIKEVSQFFPPFQ